MSRQTPPQAKECGPSQDGRKAPIRGMGPTGRAPSDASDDASMDMSTKPTGRRRDDAKPDAATAAADANRVIEPNSGGQRDRELPAYRSLRRRGGRLGPVDYTLLAMVAVGIAI